MNVPFLEEPAAVRCEGGPVHAIAECRNHLNPSRSEGVVQEPGEELRFHDAANECHLLGVAGGKGHGVREESAGFIHNAACDGVSRLRFVQHRGGETRHRPGRVAGFGEPCRKLRGRADQPGSCTEQRRGRAAVVRLKCGLETLLADPPAASAITQQRSPTVGAVEGPGVVEAEGNRTRAHNQHRSRCAVQGAELRRGGIRENRGRDLEALGKEDGEFVGVLRRSLNPGNGRADSTQGTFRECCRKPSRQHGCSVREQLEGEPGAVVHAQAGEAVLVRRAQHLVALPKLDPASALADVGHQNHIRGFHGPTICCGRRHVSNDEEEPQHDKLVRIPSNRGIPRYKTETFVSLTQLDRVPIRRALISVYDKTGLEELAKGLHAAGVAIVSTGSTAKKIAAAGIPVKEVEEVTGSPEMLDGRVKTLHPRVHGGILADRRVPAHMETLAKMEIEPFDLVVVNLYPFVETVRSGAAQDDVVEQIDIGGPAMVRSAAKNHAAVAIVVDPNFYGAVVEAAAAGGFDLKTRRRLAAKAFAHTATYDTAVATWTASQFLDEDGDGIIDWPAYAGLALERSEVLRYGENPHQQAALYVDKAAPAGIAQADQLHGKAMSYNNFVDADAALRAAFDFSEPAVAIIKHANPCGVAVGSVDAADPIADAHAKAHACDPVSAFGGVIAANSIVTAGMAQTVAGIFTEVVIAPGFEPEAVEILSKKKNIRLLALPDGYGRYPTEIRQVSGGVLVQQADKVDADGDNPANWTLAAGQAADDATLADLAFAWTACRAAKSNAILLANNGAAVGIGMGQVNRLDSCKLAVERANTLGVQVESDVDGAGGASNVGTSSAPERARGAVAASDAFFPFADGLQILIDAGVRAVVQPGGSVRDEEVIAAANAAGITMYFTGARHFFH